MLHKKYNTRIKLNFHVQVCNTVLLQITVVNMGIKLYIIRCQTVQMNWITLNSLEEN